MNGLTDVSRTSLASKQVLCKVWSNDIYVMTLATEDSDGYERYFNHSKYTFLQNQITEFTLSVGRRPVFKQLPYCVCVNNSVQVTGRI